MNYFKQNAESNRDATLFAIHSKRASPVEMATEVTEEAVDVLAATESQMVGMKQPSNKPAIPPRSRAITPQPARSRTRTPEVPTTPSHAGAAKRDGMVVTSD